MSMLLSGAMKGSLCALALLLVTNTCLSQVVPATPKNFKKRAVGDSIDSGSVNVTPPPSTPALIRTVTYYSLSESRQWTSSDGKALVGKLIAFEEHVVETVKGTPALPPPDALSTPPT
ncbi:MAG TPA: hypothetical protein VK956_20330, partial [Verrucomicrobium sp.]|nr:hypothetical protein [Verrucomicrobium sp.]